jgi:hypothetical protein
MTYLQAVTGGPDTQDETQERPEPENDGLSYGERWRLNSVPADPIHRVLFDFHPNLYRNYRLVVFELERAEGQLNRVQSELKSGRLGSEKRAALKVKRSELRMKVADREAARAYKITHLFESESARIHPKPDVDDRNAKIIEAVRLIVGAV